MSLYEAMCILDPELKEEEFEEELSRVTEEVGKAGGEMEETQKMGKRRLAYELKGAKTGFYVLLHFRCEPLSLRALRARLKLNPKILRTLILKKAA